MGAASVGRADAECGYMRLGAVWGKVKRSVLRLAGVALVASMLIAAPTEAVAASPQLSASAGQIWMTNGIGRVMSMAHAGNRVFVAGSFTGMKATYNGSTVNQKFIAAIEMWTGKRLAAFSPTVNDEVRAVAVSPDAKTVYIGGRFTTVNGQTRTRVAALDAVTGNLRTGWNVTIPSDNVEALAVDSAGDVYIGGSFSSVQGQGQRSLAKVDGVTGALESWDANITEGKVMSLALSPDEARLYVGTEIRDENNQPLLGSFVAVDPVDADPIAGFDSSVVDRPVFDIAVTGSKIYLALGGGGGAADILRATDGTRRRQYTTDGDVQGVEVVGDRAYFGGHWTLRFGTEDSVRFVAVDTSTDNIDNSYVVATTGNGGIEDMLYDGAHLWVGGHITNASPVSVRGFGRYSQAAAGVPLTPVIGARARWRYLDNGSQLGTAWRQLHFDDDSWRRGDAELGYGDGGERTVVRDGPDANRYITTYFRRTVTIYDHNNVDHLEIKLRRDDGAVVYINGVEVIRDNMLDGTITGATRAAAPVTGSAENKFNRWVISPDVLIEGDNIVAVEIHQAAPTSNDISFDLRMLIDTKPKVFIEDGARWRYRDDGPSLATAWRRLKYDDSAWKEGPAQLGYGEGDEARVISKGPAGDRHITSYFRRVFTVYEVNTISNLELEILRDDGAVVYLNDVRIVRSNMPSGPMNSEVTASTLASPPGEKKWYRYDIDPGLLVAGDNILAVEIHQKGPYSGDHSFDLRLAKQATPEELVARDTKWRYHDQGLDRGTAWRQLSYANHSNWPRGRAELGYGDGDETTVVNSGPAGNHHPTVYFRRLFRVTDPDVFSVLDIGLVRDDGAVVYINGVEVLRDNMPSGTITYDTYASGGASNENSFHEFSVPASVLVRGYNVVAVEIHQSGPGSSDLSFNFEMTAR